MCLNELSIYTAFPELCNVYARTWKHGSDVISNQLLQPVRLELQKQSPYENRYVAIIRKLLKCLCDIQANYVQKHYKVAATFVDYIICAIMTVFLEETKSKVKLGDYLIANSHNVDEMIRYATIVKSLNQKSELNPNFNMIHRISERLSETSPSRH